VVIGCRVSGYRPLRRGPQQIGDDVVEAVKAHAWDQVHAAGVYHDDERGRWVQTRPGPKLGEAFQMTS
jgi:hypothetical protein